MFLLKYAIFNKCTTIVNTFYIINVSEILIHNLQGWSVFLNRFFWFGFFGFFYQQNLEKKNLFGFFGLFGLFGFFGFFNIIKAFNQK